MDRGYNDRSYGRDSRSRSYDDYGGGGKGYSGGKGGHEDRGRDDRRGGFDSYGGGKGSSGGGSSYRDYQPARNSKGGGGGYSRGGGRGGGKGRLVPEGPRQRGLIASVKESFGFIECEENDERVFFHFSEIGDRGHRVEKGDCVEFGVAKDDRSGKSSACEIDILRPGSVVLEEELEGRFEGFVLKELRGSRLQDASGGVIQLKPVEGAPADAAPETVAFSGVDLSDIRWKPADGDVVEFNLVLVKRGNVKRAKKIKFLAPGGGNREQGIVSTIKDSFGFVECSDRPARLFFHFTELIDRTHEPRIGDEVEFNVVSSDRHGQDNCSRVVILPKGTVSFEIEQEGRWRGKITRELRAAPRRRGAPGKGGPPPEKPSGRITLESDEAAPAEADAPSETAENTTAASDTGVEAQMAKVSVKGPKTVSFDDTSFSRDDPRMIVGDEVEMTLVIDKRTKQQRAMKLTILNENPARERGVVCSVRDAVATVRCAERPERVTFKAYDEVRTKEHEVKVGDNVEFTVLEGGGNQKNVCRVDILESGTVVLDKALGRKQGKVVSLNSCKPDQWSRNQQSGTLSSGGQLEVPADIEGEEPKLVDFNVQDLKNETTLDSRALLALGDTLAFNAVVELRTGLFSALDLELAEMDPAQREQGTVTTVKDQYGFIKSADRDVRIFFHFSQQMNSSGEPAFGTEVEFNVEKGDAKGETATRVKTLPRGTVVFEMPIEGRFPGIVVSEAKKTVSSARGHGQRPDVQVVPGTIEIEASLVEHLLSEAQIAAATPKKKKAPRTKEAAAPKEASEPAEAEAAEAEAPAEEAPTEAAPAEDAPAEDAGEEEVAAPTKKLQIKFRPDDVVNRATPYIGDAVEISIMVQKRNDGLSAKEIVAQPKAGTVTQLRGRQGFIKHHGVDEKGAPVAMDTHFYTDDVQDDVQLKGGDEVEFIVSFDSRSKSARCVNIRRTKEAPESVRPERTRMQLQKRSVTTGSKQSKGPDGTIGFAFGSYGRQRKSEIDAEPEPAPMPEPSSLDPAAAEFNVQAPEFKLGSSEERTEEPAEDTV